MLTCFPGSALFFSFISPTNWYSIDGVWWNSFTTLLSGVLEYYHASLEPIMQYPYLRTDVFQGFREIGNAILFCLQLESFLVRNITFRLRVVPQSSGILEQAECVSAWENGRAQCGEKRRKDFLSSLRASPFSRMPFPHALAYLACSTVNVSVTFHFFFSF